MDLTALVDVAIGLIFVYLGASLFVTVANEYVGQLLSLRANMLKKNLTDLINGDAQVDPKVLNAFKANPALRPFFEEDEASGTYVDPTLLAHQLVGGVRKGATAAASMQEIVASIETMRDCRLKTQLQALAQSTEDKVEAFVDNVGAWVDSSLSMMGESYKRHMQIIGLVVGFVTAMSLNLDTFAITTRLYEDKEARVAVSLLASDFVQQTSGETLERCMALDAAARADDDGCAGVNGLLDGLRQRNENLGVLPIGWDGGIGWGKVWNAIWSTALFGWFLTALATSLGATFWFDLLSKLVNVRHGMRKPVPRGSA